jgi:ATP-dependent Clp protease, protease subunit
MPERDDWKPEDRFLYLIGELDDDQAREIVGAILQHWNREFLLIINSDGGSCYGALGLVNVMRQHGRVDTLCIGVAESAAADCLAAGRRRYIVPGSIAMLHQVSWELGREFTANFLKNAQALERLNGMMTERLAEFTGKPREQLERDLATDFYLYDQEIIEYGLADAYWDPKVVLPPVRHRAGRLRGEGGERRARRAPPDDHEEPR